MGNILFSKEKEDPHFETTCPRLSPHDVDYGHRLRHPLRNLVESVCPKPGSGGEPAAAASATAGSASGGVRRARGSRLKASEFTAGNMKQINELRAMGIKIMSMPDGRVQLLHTASDVRLVTTPILGWRMTLHQKSLQTRQLYFF